MKPIFLAVVASAILLSSCQRREPQTEKSKQEVTELQADTKSGSALLVEAKEKLSEAKERLIQDGKYSCCIKDPCNYCALHESSCLCFNDLKEGRHVCIECYAGWQQEKGAVENIKKESVKTDFVKHEHAH